MKIYGVIITASLDEIITELQRQLRLNNIPYLNITQDSGDNIMVQCPYHKNGQENRPSAGIHKETGTFHCFGCGEVHTLPEVISYCFGKNDFLGKYGMKWLVKNFATVRVEERKDVEIDVERNNTSDKNNILDNNSSNKSEFVTEEELDSYRYYHGYWDGRGITEADIVELFDLGYDANSRCITMPVRDINGKCLFIARRSVDRKWFNYPKDVEKPLYGIYELSQRTNKPNSFPNKLFITESMIDCILLWQAGHFAVALNGTGTALQFRQLQHMPIRHFVLATDNDSAGQKAREKIKQSVHNKIFTEIEFPNGIKDVGDLGKARRFDDIKNIERWEVF